MARIIEALRRQPTPTPSGEATPRRDRARGTKGRVLATAATLLLAVPGVALATMGNTGEGPNGGQHASSVISHGQGEIHPAGAPGWCLTGKAGPGGTPPKENSVVEVRPCSSDNPFQQWIVAIEQTPDEPDKMVAQLHGLNLCLSGNLVKPRTQTFPAMVNDCNSPLASLVAREVSGNTQIWNPTEPQLLAVPSHLGRRAPYPLALWLDADLLDQPQVRETENVLFALPLSHTSSGGSGSPASS